MVTDIMHHETLYELAKVLGELNEGFMQMLHMTGDMGWDHTVFEKLAEISGRPIIYSTVSPLDVDPNNHRSQMNWLRGCRERGLCVAAQAQTTRAPYYSRMDEFNLFDNSDAWAQATTGTHDERKARMGDPARREVLRNDVPYVIFYLGDVKIREAKLERNKHWTGRTLTQIAQETGKHIVDVFLDIAVEEDLKTEFQAPQVTGNKSAWLKEVIDDPYIMFGTSDGGAHTRFITTGGYTTKTIINFVREFGWITLEDVHWRLSALSALIMRLRDRGTLTVGSAADIVAYDLENLTLHQPEAAIDFPANVWRRIVRPSGYRYILVNGEVTIRDDRETGTCSGKLLRGGSARTKKSRALAAE